MFCGLCGGRNDGEARYCSACGHPLASSAPTTEEPLPAVPYRPEKSHSPYAAPQAPLGVYDSRDNQAYQPHVDTHLGLAVAAILFGCVPVGAVALYHSAQVKPHLRAGDVDSALRASRLAKWWALGAMAFNLLAVGLMIVAH